MTSTIESLASSEVDLVQTLPSSLPLWLDYRSTEDLHYGNHPKDGEGPSRCLLWNDRHPSSKRETDFNVAIRTLQMQGNQAIYGVGGGASLGTANGKVNTRKPSKNRLSLYRQEPRFELLTTGCIHQGELTFLDQHVTRLREASRYFAYPYDESKLLKELQEELLI